MRAHLKYLRIGGGAALSLASAQGWAASSGAPVMTVNTITSSAPNLGTIIAATNTTFTIDPATGAVTASGGSGIQLHTAGNATATVTVKCGNQTLCATTRANVYIHAVGSPSNRAGPLANFKVSMGTASLATGSSAGPASPLSFSLNPIGVSGSQTFNVGMDFPIAGDSSGQTGGTSVSNFEVLIAPAPTAGSAGTGKIATGATVKVFHGLTMGHNAPQDDLAFGSIVPAPSGSAFIKVDDTSVGALTTGKAVALSSAAHHAALFTIVGEGTERFTISLPSPITLTSAGDATKTISVTLQGSATTSHTLDGVLGTPSTYPLYVGGSFTLPSTGAPGVYKGTMSVTIAYP
jgi:hypothetical protein